MDDQQGSDIYLSPKCRRLIKARERRLDERFQREWDKAVERRSAEKLKKDSKNGSAVKTRARTTPKSDTKVSKLSDERRKELSASLRRHVENGDVDVTVVEPNNHPSTSQAAINVPVIVQCGTCSSTIIVGQTPTSIRREHFTQMARRLRLTDTELAERISTSTAHERQRLLNEFYNSVDCTNLGVDVTTTTTADDSSADIKLVRHRSARKRLFSDPSRTVKTESGTQSTTLPIIGGEQTATNKAANDLNVTSQASGSIDDDPRVANDNNNSAFNELFRGLF